MVDTFTHFLYDLSMGLTSQECTELEFLAGGYSSHCCCTGRDGGSPAHGVLMRIQRAGVFTEDNLGSLTGLLKIMGRNDLAQKCTSYDFSKDSRREVQETGHLQSVSIDFQPRPNLCQRVVDERTELVGSCPAPSASVQTGTSSAHLPDSTRGCSSLASSMSTPSPTWTETCACVHLHVCKGRRILPRRKAKGSTPLHFSGTPDSVLSDEYDIVEVQSPSSNSAQDSPVKQGTQSSARPSSLGSLESSPSPDPSLSSPTQSPTCTPTLEGYVEVRSPHSTGFFIPRGQSLDVPSSSSASNSMSRTRSWTSPIRSLIRFRRPMQASYSDSCTRDPQRRHAVCCNDCSCPPSYLWSIKLSNLLSKISKRQQKAVEMKFLVKTLADRNKFYFEFLLRLYPNGLNDFDQDRFCTLTIDARCKDNQHLSKQQLRLHVVGVAGRCVVKEVMKLCVVGETLTLTEFLSHDVLRSSEAKTLELKFGLHLQYTLDGEDASWEYIGKDQVL